MKVSPRARRIGALFVFASLIGLGSYYLVNHPQTQKFFEKTSSLRTGLTKTILAKALIETGKFQEFPSEVEIPVNGKPSKAVVQYSFDPHLQDTMEKLFRSYRPDYGAFVAIDATSGRVLSLVSYVNGNREVKDHLALRATFPSASVFKVVTAAAAIAEKNLSANSVITFSGRNHTLYRSNVLKEVHNRWTRNITLKEAFAHSVNTVFAKIGAFTVGAESLKTYADRFGFNRVIAADLPIQEGRAPIKDEPWALAETASGYTRDNTMSPLQGALIAAAVVNDGIMMEPFAISSVHAQDGAPVYVAEPTVSSMVIGPGTASEIRALMRETVSKGTSRGSFRGFFKGPFSFLDVGGKTGSLTGSDPAGKYDWFIGFAEGGTNRIAVAALTVHEKYWKVKSSYVARKAFEEYFRRRLLERTVAHQTKQRS